MRERISLHMGSSFSLLLLTLFAVLVFPVVGLPQSQAPKPKVERTPIPENNETSGATLYHSYCATCHGQNGKGNGPAASALKTTPTDLTLLAKNNGNKFPSDHVQSVLSNESEYSSHGSKDMPIWGPIFSRMGTEKNMRALRVHNITEYLKSIQAK